MAIFGALAELPLPEVLTMLGRRSGKLKMWGLAKGKLEMHLSEAHLKAMVINGQPIIEIFDVRETMSELMNSSEGEFEFERMPPEQLTRLLDIPLERLLITTFSNDDEIETYRNRFAHPSTRFRSVNAIDIWIYDDLYDFWQRSSELLTRGSSAEDISRALDMPLEHVQLKLYKLRSLGKISPVRAFYARRTRSAPTVTSSMPNSSPPVPSGQPSNIPNTIPGMPTPPSPTPATQNRQVMPSASSHDPTSSYNPTPSASPTSQRTLVSRLLKALQIGKRS